MLQIVLIRPGSTDYDVQERIQGSLDIPLNEQGLAEVAADGGATARQGDGGRSTRPFRSRRCKRPRSIAKALGIKLKKIERLQNLNQGLVAGDARGRRAPQAAEGLSPVAGAAGERLPARRRDAQRRPTSGSARRMVKLLKRHKEGVIGLVLPEPLLSLARRFITHGELGDLWKAPNGHGRFEVLDGGPGGNPRRQRVREG